MHGKFQRQKPANLNLTRMHNAIFYTTAVVLLLASLNTQAASTSRQALTTTILRVCADPSNLPFSNDKLEGFENKIIAKIAEKLELDVRYTWFPQTIGFVRNTLRMRDCDLISGITTTSELVQNCLLYTSPSPRDATLSRMPSSA